MGLTSVDIRSSNAHEYSTGLRVVNQTPRLGCHRKDEESRGGEKTLGYSYTGAELDRA